MLDQAKTGGTGSQFEQALRKGRFVVTAEVTPPASFDRQDLLAKAMPLKGLADAVNVTDGAGARAHLSSVMAATFLLEQGIEPILQLACRDRNRIALQSDLMAAAAAGVHNFLALRGDNPSAGDQPDAKPVFDLDSRTLLETARRLRDQGELPSGRKVAGRAQFFLGAADSPIDPPAGWKPDGLHAKIASGAQFVQTQFCMDAAIVRRYVDRLWEYGIPEKLFILIGVAPLRSAKSARWIVEHLPGAIIAPSIIERLEKAADAPAEGLRICVEFLEQLSEIKGIAGAHVMAPGSDVAIPQVLASASHIARRSGKSWDSDSSLWPQA